MHESLTTKSMLCNRGMLQTNLYPRCNQAAETIMHYLRDRDFVNLLWESFCIMDPNIFEEDDIYVWLSCGVDGDYSLFFLAVCWWLWRARNKLCLANEMIAPYTLKLLTTNYVNLLSNCFIKNTPTPSTRLVTWNAENRDFMILNVGNPSVLGF